VLATGLPELFQGWPVRYGWDAVQVDHHVTVTCVSDWLVEQLGVDATLGMSLADWLVTPQQRILGVVAGAVYADDRGELAGVRAELAWYPDQVWRWLLAAQWRRLAQEEAFVHRTSEVGDELGSAVIAGRLARDIMRLALLLERRYAPYGKWLGSAFARLDQTDGLGRHLKDAVHAPGLEQREAALSAAYVAVARRHDRAGLTEPLDPTLRPYHSRPAQVLLADRYAGLLGDGRRRIPPGPAAHRGDRSVRGQRRRPVRAVGLPSPRHDVRAAASPVGCTPAGSTMTITVRPGARVRCTTPRGTV
jgi:hypothetical protein